MPYYVYNESKLISDLSSLSTNSMVAFSISCAERQKLVSAIYEKEVLQNDENIFGQTLAQLWDVVLKNDTSRDLNNVLEKIYSIFPEEQHQWSPIHVYADHALATLAYSTRCFISRNPQEAAWAARRAYEAADQAAIKDIELNMGTNYSEGDIQNHFIVQRELERQQSAISYLSSKSASLQTLMDTCKKETIFDYSVL